MALRPSKPVISKTVPFVPMWKLIHSLFHGNIIGPVGIPMNGTCSGNCLYRDVILLWIVCRSSAGRVLTVTSQRPMRTGFASAPEGLVFVMFTYLFYYLVTTMSERASAFSGRPFDRVDLIKPVSNVRPSVRPQSFFDFNEICHCR